MIALGANVLVRYLILGNCSGHLMHLYQANRNDPHLRIDTKAIQMIRNVQLIEFIVESANLEQELT